MRITSIDLQTAMTEHPVRTLAIAFAVGVGLAWAERARGAIGQAVVAAISGVIATLAREQLVHQARSWIDERRAPSVVH